MVSTRRNILANATDRHHYIDACLALKAESAGVTTADLGIDPGSVGHRPLSTWDLFVIWHVRSMNQMSSDNRRNAAHSGPVFLPWHRWYLLLLEWQMRRVLGLSQDDFGIPYWDWAKDGELPPAQQPTAALWTHIGGDGTGPLGEVRNGPFVQTAFPINVEQSPFGPGLRSTNRALRRSFADAASWDRLPQQAHENSTLQQGRYDEPTWDAGAEGFRNRLEGWRGPNYGPNMHNLVHMWVGGDMGPATSPNDPVFFLNHCNVDRIWLQWQLANPARAYAPRGTSPGPADPLYRHRSGNPLFSLLTTIQPRVEQLWDITPYYVYA